MVGGFYMALAGAPTLALAALCVLLAHFGGSILWVFSTVLLQIEVPDRFRGRVFAAELALVTLISSVSSYLTGYAARSRGLVAARAGVRARRDVLRPGLLWLLILSRWQDQVARLDTGGDAVGGRSVLEGRVG